MLQVQRKYKGGGVYKSGQYGSEVGLRMTLPHSQRSHDRDGEEAVHRTSTQMGWFSGCDRAETDTQNAVELIAPAGLKE